MALAIVSHVIEVIFHDMVESEDSKEDMHKDDEIEEEIICVIFEDE